MRMFKLLLLILISFITCSPVKTPTIKDIAVYDLTEEPRVFPLDIYVTNEFNSEQKDAIKNVLEGWNVVSEDEVKYNLILDWVPPIPFNESYHIDDRSITVWRKNWNDPCMFNLQMENTFVATGFSYDNIIILIDRDDLDYRAAYIIFAHEFGHSIGMEHIYDRYPALMNLGANGGSFTKFDKLMFCEMYKCY